jgi:threonine/homoserine/homoserine lactone efflux protein
MVMPTQSLLAVLGFAIAISFAAVISPGPVTAAVISEALRRGWLAGPLISSGHALLELVMCVLLAIGLTGALQQPLVRKAIALAGGALLLAIALRYLISAFQQKIRLPAPGDNSAPRSAARLFSLGLLTTLSNPFWYAWWITVAAGYLTQARSLGLPALAAFFIGHVSTDYAWNTLLAVLVKRGSRFLDDRRYRWLIALTGAFMLYLAALFIHSAFRIEA